MRVLHLNAGNETGGGMVHILNLFSHFDQSEITLGLFQKGEFYQNALKKQIPVKLFSSKNTKDLKVLHKLIRYINDSEFDFIHTHGPRATFFLAIIKPFINTPVITTIHSNPSEDFVGKGFKGKIYHSLHRFSFRYVDHFVVVSEEFTRMMKRNFNLNDHQLNTIYNGIDFDQHLLSVSKEKYGYNRDDFLIMMPARLEKVKQHHLAIKAVKSLVLKYPQVKLLLLGDGSEMGNVSRLISDLGLSEKVHLLGYREDIQEFLSCADLVLLTSKSESFPLVLLEAARAKVPIVTTDVGDVSKLIPDKKFGWVVKDHSIDGIEAAIIEVINESKKGIYKPQCIKLYEYASKRFSMKHFCDSYRHIYRELHSHYNKKLL
ncbi:glycosyltransferase [Halalkalibacillus sediminis]|uniref:Glycosyltransferase n=1 Tax=Halalkalibacillus sediminis TaxID=2018042 RepID=A0A2I0QTX1_9BACI|nr:glycosyltransferase [Halalkalibacillus sediminis]PKR77791.1 glycosyltransferase [Halalkalibacillus sediminis]